MTKTEKVCEYCGTIFSPNNGKQRFCCKTCRQTSWRIENKDKVQASMLKYSNKIKEINRNKFVPPIRCGYCDISFIPKKHNQKYCGVSCRKKRDYQNRKDKIAEYSKKYRKINKEKIKEKKKDYYNKNKERLIEYQKNYKEVNKDKIKIQKKEYHMKNKEEIKERRKKYYQDNKDVILEKNKNFRELNKEKIKVQKKKYYNNNKEVILKKIKAYHEKNLEQVREKQKQWYERNKERILIKLKNYWSNNKEVIKDIQEKHIRKLYNDCEEENVKNSLVYQVFDFLNRNPGKERNDLLIEFFSEHPKSISFLYSKWIEITYEKYVQT